MITELVLSLIVTGLGWYAWTLWRPVLLDRYPSLKTNPLYKNPPKPIKIIGTVTNKTPAGFSIRNELELRCEWFNKEQFKKNRMLEKESQNNLVEYYNNYLETFLDNWGGFFHLELSRITKPEDADFAIRAPVCRITSEKGSFIIRAIRWGDLIHEYKLDSYKRHGCYTTLADFNIDLLCRETVERNYAMLSDEQRAAVMSDDRYGQYEQMLAVAALKRRLEFVSAKPENYDSELFSIETESAGRGLKIKWRFKPDAKRGGYDIIGFRRTGGFYADQWDEANNGVLVIQSNKDGETVELLREGEAQFYTFFLKPWREDKRTFRRSPLRFQVTIATSEETNAIKTTLDRIERQSFNPPTHNVSAALRELGLYAEFDNAIEQRRKVMEGQIESSRCTRQEKEEKLSRLLDVVAAVRDKYQQ